MKLAARRNDKQRLAGVTLVEMVFAAAIGCAVIGALLVALSVLRRNYAAVEAYAVAEGNQMRISDYIAFDVRRSLTVNVVNNVLTITVPDYYGNGGAVLNSASTPLEPVVVNGSAGYDAAPLTIKYYQQGSVFQRTVNGVATAIADDVADFSVTAQDLGDAVSCRMTFSPRFAMNPSADAIAATSVFIKVYPRNASARQ